jgi:2-methylcitrate dehydratase PrpD
MPATSSVMEQLTHYMDQARTAKVPPAVLESAKHHILDTLAAMVSGSQLKPGRFAIAYAQQQAGPAEAQVAGSRLRVSAINAALANGMLAHADETDDSHGEAGMHPGCAVVPAALAMAERENASGLDFVRAVVLGYDVGCRINQALGRAALRARHHLPFSIGGTMAATAAAGSLAGLRREQFAHLLSYGAQQASGVMTYARDTEHIEKAFIFGGMGARNGVTAATMLQSGFTGVDDVFSGDGNFFLAYAENAKLEEVVAELGSRYEVARTNIKKYCVGFPIQLPLDGLMLIMKEHGIGAADIAQVVARVEPGGAHTVNDREMPDINLQYLFAVAMLDGDVSFAAAHSFERMREPEIVKVKTRVSLIPDPELSRPAPGTVQREAVVEVRTNDGRKIEKRVTTFRGSADNPLSTEEVQKKALDLMEPVFGRAQANELISAVGQLETLSSARALAPLLQA